MLNGWSTSPALPNMKITFSDLQGNFTELFLLWGENGIESLFRFRRK